MLHIALALAVAVALALWDCGLLIVPTLDGPWRGAVHPPSLARVGLALALGIVVAWLARKQSAAVRRPLLLLGLAAAPLVPVLTGRGVLLLAFQDWTIVLVATAAAAAAASAAWRGRHAPAVPGWLLVVAAFIFYMVLGTRIPGHTGPQGDEPHYLLLAHSLVHDGDLDLANQMAERQYLGFYGGQLTPHASAASPPGHLYLTHAPGVGVLIAPAYALGGYRLVVLFLSALVAIAAALLRAVVREAAGNEALALATWAIVALTPPLPFYALAIYPETVAVCALALLLWLRLGTPGLLRALVAALVGGSLVWLHPKMLPLGGLGLALVLLRVPGRGARALAATVWSLAVASFLLYMRLTFGHATLSAGFGDPHLSLSALPWGALAMLFDRQAGLLMLGPVWVLAVFGVRDRLRAAPLETLLLLALAAAPIAIGGAYGDWAGGAGPPGRFPIPSLAPACVLLAAALVRRPRLAAALAGLGFGILLVAWRVPSMLRMSTPGESHLLRDLAPADLNAVFPSFTHGSPSSAVTLALALAAVALLAGLFRTRGLVLGLAGYCVLALALADRPFVHQAMTTLRVIDSWDGSAPMGPQGRLDLARLALALPLRGDGGPIPSGESRRTRRIGLPPGAYVAEVRAARTPAPSRGLVELAANDILLAAGDVGGGATLSMPLLLPTGANGLGFAVTGEQGSLAIELLQLRPLAIVPRASRARLDWAERPRAERYRLERGALRVTLVAELEPEGTGFRVTGASGRLVIDGPPAAIARLTLRRTAAGSQDEVELPGAPLPLGPEENVTLELPLSRGFPLGSGGAVLPVQVRARDAFVTVEDATARP